MSDGSHAGYAELHLPLWVGGGKPTRLLEDADLVGRRDQASGKFRVRTSEAYYNRRPQLVVATELAGPGVTPRYSDLGRRRERVEHHIPGFVYEAIAARAAKAETSSEVLDMFSHARLSLYAVPANELASHIEMFHRALLEVPVQDDPSERPFANSAVQLVEVAPALHMRLKLASLELRLEQDERLGGGDLGYFTNHRAAQERAFASSEGLYDGTLLFDAYLDPLLAALTPGVWALDIVRSFGNLIITLGQPLAGTNGDASELLQLISIPGAAERVPVPRLPSGASVAAVDWWTGALNDLFAVLSDPAVFTDVQRRYQPSRHLQTLLTTEQLFRRTASLLLAHRDVHARRALFFTVLDTLEPLTGRNIVTHCDHDFARSTLERVRHRLPTDACEVLLPTAQRGVEALRLVQEGFFIQRQLGGRAVELKLPSGTRVLPPADAAAHYIKTLRDATHGHGSNRASKAALTEALLAHHDGNVPHDLGLLALLYLLEFLQDPTRLRRVLCRS